MKTDARWLPWSETSDPGYQNCDLRDNEITVRLTQFETKFTPISIFYVGERGNNYKKNRDFPSPMVFYYHLRP